MTAQDRSIADRLRALLLPALVTVVALVVLISLGNWQLRRLAWKEDLIARIADRPSGPVRDLPPPADWPNFNVAEGEYRPYVLAGHFLHDKEVRVFTSLPDPKGRLGGPGFWIVTPFALDGGGTVLVNRGFAPQGRHLPDDRDESLAVVDRSLVGLMRPDESRHLFLPADRPDENVFFARDIATIASAKDLPRPVAPFTLDLRADATPPEGLPQAGETRLIFSNNHLQYALTWYGLAAALLVVFAAFAIQRLRERPDARLTPGSEPP